MKTEDYQRLISRMNEIKVSDKAAILVVMDDDLVIHTATFGEPGELAHLRKVIPVYVNINVGEDK